MTFAVRALVAVVGLGLVAGCAAKRLPPGTPPPEYETRELPPWSGDTPDAGMPAPAPAEAPSPPAEGAPPQAPADPPKSEPLPLDAGMSPSPDAGVR
jgi:hypothetical protein